MMKSLFNKALLKEQFKRFWGIGAINFAAYFLVILLPIWRNTDQYYTESTIRALYNFNHPMILVLSIIVPFITVSAMFSYLYQNNSTGVMHALPFTKKQLFLSNSLVGFILFTAPLAIFSVLLLVKPIVYYGLSLTLPAIIAFFLKTLVIYVFYYCLFILAAMLAGSRAHYIMLSVLLPFVLFLIYLLYGGACALYLFGYTFNNNMLVLMLMLSNPVVISALLPEVAAEYHFLVFIAYALVSAAVFLLAFWLYHKRKLERTGVAVVFEPLKKALVFLISLYGMSIMGLFLASLTNTITFLYIGFILGFIISYFVARMIMEKSFNVFNNFKTFFKYLCVLLGMFAIVFLDAGLDVSGYIRYTPEASKVKGVYLYWDNNQGSVNRYLITNREIIQETLVAHQSIIDNRENLFNIFNLKVG